MVTMLKVMTKEDGAIRMPHTVREVVHGTKWTKTVAKKAMVVHRHKMLIDQGKEMTKERAGVENSKVATREEEEVEALVVEAIKGFNQDQVIEAVAEDLKTINIGAKT